METLEELDIPYEKTAPKTETAVGDSSLGLSILGAVERKLIVRIASEEQDVLIVHALTQKMLLDLTEHTPLSGDTLVVADGFMEDSVKMKELLDRIQAKQLIVENGWHTPEDDCGIPIVSPNENGDINIKIKRN